jgi:tetratricopeptide (TPR) repeat protein
MIKKSTFVTIVLLSVFIKTYNQEVQKYDSTAIASEKAKYLQGDLTVLLSAKVKYPEDALMKDIQGDVLFSFSVKKDGRSEKLLLVGSPDISLSTGSIVALNSIIGAFSPARINNVPVDKEYLIVFRYRIFINSQPTDYRGLVKKSIDKQKYDKALKLCNQGIIDNEYDSGLFELRSIAKEKLGDAEGAKKDKQAALKLNDEIMTIINVNATGYTRRQSIMVGTEIRKL